MVGYNENELPKTNGIKNYSAGEIVEMENEQAH